MIDIIKQKQVYFLFTKMENSGQYDRTVYGLVIDFYIDNVNNYGTLDDISNHFKTKGISIAPEVIWNSLNILNTNQVFDNFPHEGENETPFRLSKDVYDDFVETTGYIEKLKVYVKNFLTSSGYPINAEEDVIDLLLETIFTRNIKYLKHILTLKDEKSLVMHFSNNNSRFSPDVNRYYNNMLITSNGEFDEILKALILRMFDFLSLNYNPKHQKTLKKRFGGTTYYLDSSFIIRLLGFDNEKREARSLELIEILNSIEGVQFCVHTKTIDEAQKKIEELIDKYSNILNKPIALVRKLTSRIPKESDLLQLYLRMQERGRIYGLKDFRLYFKNIKRLLSQNIRGLCYDDKSLYNTNPSQRKELYNALQNSTQKTQGRINHIVKLLDHIDRLRGSNNYNPFDIKYWLITTDQKTLQLDAAYIEEVESKSVCIMPSELIRLVDGVGDIRGEHMHVFKNYILHSHVYPNDYSDKDIETIGKIAAIIESIDLQKYDVDIMLDNLFQDNSYNNIQSRLKNLEDEDQRDKALIDMFVSSNSEYMDSSYSRIYQQLRTGALKQAGTLWGVIVYMWPVGLAIYILGKTFNWEGVQWNYLTTYFHAERWEAYQIVFTVLFSVVFAIFMFIRNRYKDRFVSWYVKRVMKKYKDSKPIAK